MSMTYKFDRFGWRRHPMATSLFGETSTHRNCTHTMCWAQRKRHISDDKWQTRPTENRNHLMRRQGGVWHAKGIAQKAKPLMMSHLTSKRVRSLSVLLDFLDIIFVSFWLSKDKSAYARQHITTLFTHIFILTGE